MASTRSRPYTVTTRPRETAREPSDLAQILQRERRAPPLVRAPPAPLQVPLQVQQRERRVPPLVGAQRERRALPLARAPRERRVPPLVGALRERRVPRVLQQGRPPTAPPERAPAIPPGRALQDQRPQAIAPRVGTT